MLKLLKSKLKKINRNSLKNKNFVKKYKSYVPSVRDWKNSVYTYNKNYLNLMPTANKLTMKIIRSYFNSYNLKSERKIRKKIRKNWRKKSLNKIYLSDGEYKYTNDKILITMYLYNRQKINLLIKLNKLFKKILKRKKNFLFKRIFLNRDIMLKLISYKQMKHSILLKSSLFKNLQYKLYTLYRINLLKKKYKLMLIKKFKFYLYYNQLICFNKLKFSNLYLQGLINLIRKIYKKNVDFNIINLKSFFANSDILIQPLRYKYRKKRKLMKYFRRFMNKIKVQTFKLIDQRNYFFNDRYLILEKKDVVDNLFNDLFLYNKINFNSLKEIILYHIKYKKIVGIRVSVSGRLTRRYTAARAVYKVKYQGNLQNVYASKKKYSYSLLRSKFQPNLDYKKLSYKSRIGSFGLKGWISGN
jgi:hypothetical protein